MVLAQRKLFDINVFARGSHDMSINNMHTCFIDFQKGFDQVKDNKLIETLKDIGLGGSGRIIPNFYWNQTSIVRIK